MDRDEMSNHYRGPPIDVSYQVLIHLAQGFQRRRLKCEKQKDDGRQVMAKATELKKRGLLTTDQTFPMLLKVSDLIDVILLECK